MSKRLRPTLPLPDISASPGVCRRQQSSRWYADKALAAIEALPCAEYFRATNARGAKISLLAELGRLGDPMDIRKVAELLTSHAHEQRLTVSAAERLLRQTRRKLKAEKRI